MGVAELKRQSSAIAHHLQNINQNVTSLFTKSIREWTRSEHENSLLVEQNHQKRIPCIESRLLTIPWYQGWISKELKHEKEWTIVSKLNCFIRAQQSDKSGTFIKNFSFAHQTRTTRDVNLDLSLYATLLKHKHVGSEVGEAHFHVMRIFTSAEKRTKHL